MALPGVKNTEARATNTTQKISDPTFFRYRGGYVNGGQSGLFD